MQRLGEIPESMSSASVSNQASVLLRPSPMSANKARIQDWRLDTQDASSVIHTDDMKSLSASAFVEEDLEERVSQRFGDNPSFVKALISNLKEKADFILPIFGIDDDLDLFESPFITTPAAYDQESSQGTTPSSTGCSGSKNSNTSTSATPATSADSGKADDPTDGEEKSSKNQQSSSKRRSRGSGGPEGRRLRCHFHAKCPANHNKRTCTHSGWLSIHNLKYGHRSRII